jgi:two-component system CheB/CheR fusion protein
MHSEICGGQWNIPKLRKLLDDVLIRKHRVDDYEVEHDLGKNGSKRLLLNVRCVAAVEGEEPLLVVSVKEVNR